MHPLYSMAPLQVSLPIEMHRHFSHLSGLQDAPWMRFMQTDRHAVLPHEPPARSSSADFLVAEPASGRLSSPHVKSLGLQRNRSRSFSCRLIRPAACQHDSAPSRTESATVFSCNRLERHSGEGPETALRQPHSRLRHGPDHAIVRFDKTGEVAVLCVYH